MISGRIIFTLFAVALTSVCLAHAAGLQSENATSKIDEVLIYSNGMALTQSTASANLASTGRALLLMENFSQSAQLGTFRSSMEDTPILMAKRFMKEEKISEKIDYNMNLDELLNQSIGKQISVGNEQGVFSGKLMWVSVGALAIQNNSRLNVISYNGNSIISFETNSSFQVKKEIERNTTRKKWGIELSVVAEKPGKQSFPFSFIDSGAKWTPSYNIDLSTGAVGAGKIDAMAEVSNNGGVEWENTKMKLAVGSPYFIESSRAYNLAPTYNSMQMEKAASDSVSGSGNLDFSGNSVGTQYVYTLSEPVTLTRGESAIYRIFNSDVNYSKFYVWENQGLVQKAVKITNAAGKPFAAGIARIYDGGIFAGEALMEYIGESRDAELKYAAYPQIKVVKGTNRTTSETFFDRRETAYDVSIKIESSANTTDTLRLRDSMGYGDQVRLISSSVSAAQLSGNRLEWQINVPANANLSINYKYVVINFQ